MTRSPGKAACISLQACLALRAAHASLTLKLDDELGTHHGLGWSEFALLSVLARSDAGQLRLTELALLLGLSLSNALRQILALEKIGLLERLDNPTKLRDRRIRLRQAGRAALAAAEETAEEVCTQALREVPNLMAFKGNLERLAASSFLSV